MVGTNGVSNILNTYNSNHKNDLDIIIDKAKNGSLSEVDLIVLKELVNHSKLNPVQLNNLRIALSDYSSSKSSNNEVSDLVDNVNKLIKEIEDKIKEVSVGAIVGGSPSGLFADNVIITNSFSSNSNQSNKTYIDATKAQAEAGSKESATSSVIAAILDEKILSKHSIEGLC